MKNRQTRSRIILAPLLLVAIALGPNLSGQVTTAARVGDGIPLRGLAANHYGLVLWNTGPGAAEPAMTGHTTTWTPCSVSAPYYVATRDHADIDVAATHGFRATPSISGLPAVTQALSTNGFRTADLTLSWTTQSLGADREGFEWFFDSATNVETRDYTGGEFTLQLNGDPLIGGPMPRTTVRIDYNVLTDCSDNDISVETTAAVPANRSMSSAAEVQAVAAAFLDDLAGLGLTFEFATLQPTAQPLSANGRTGAFYEASDGAIEVDAPCSCAIGIYEADDTHEWTLRWTEATVPADGPVRLKMVATTLAPSAGPAGTLTATFFDESGPGGVTLDLAYPTTKGDAEGWLELDILPQKTYRFIVSRIGVGRHYRVGASHAALRLAQADQRFLPGRAQDWAIEAGVNERVTIELATDEETQGAQQATRAVVMVRDADSGAVVHGPVSLALSPGTPQTVEVDNGGRARRLVVRIDPDGAFRMRKVGGDEQLAAMACPASSASSTPTLTLTSAGITPSGLQISLGQQVLIVNQSGVNRKIQSNPHPFHTECPALNAAGVLGPGESGLTGTFDTVRTCGFHDHLSPFDGTVRDQIIVGSGSGGQSTDPGGGGGGGYLQPRGPGAHHHRPSP